MEISTLIKANSILLCSFVSIHLLLHPSTPVTKWIDKKGKCWNSILTSNIIIHIVLCVIFCTIYIITNIK